MELQSITSIEFATELDYLSIISATNQEAARQREDKRILAVSTSERPGRKQAQIMLFMGSITPTEAEEITEIFMSGVMATLEQRHDITRAVQMSTTITPT